VPWYDGLWPVLPAILTAAAAFWQFGGLKDSQKATELAHLEQVITSAAARKDPVEHGYRAYLLQRLQALHGNRSSSGFFAAIWGFLTLMFLLMMAVSRGATWVGQLIIFAGLFGSMMLAARNLGKYLYGSRTLDLETAQAYELSMVAARQSFVDSAKDLPPLRPQPQLGKKAINAWKSTTKARKRDLGLFAGLVAFVVGLGIFGYQAWQKDWIEWREAVTWTSWTAAGCVAILPIWSRTLANVTNRFQPQKVGQILYVLVQVAWVVLTLRFTPSWFEDLLYKTIEDDTSMGYKELFTMLASFVGTGLLLVLLAALARWARWRKSRQASTQTAP
jgi:hypothetical protein